MERDEFIKSLGLGLALVCTGACMEGCGSKSSDPSPAPGGGGGGGTSSVSVDLTSQLLTIGSFVRISGVLFFRIAAGNQSSSFVATEAVCPHAGGNLYWTVNHIECDNHHSTYNTSGAVLSQPVGGGVTRALKIYATSITGNTLTATVA